MKINKIIGIATLVTGMIAMSSCLKNGAYYTDFAAAAASVDLPLAATNNNGVVTFSFDATVTTTSIPVYVDVASPSIPNKANTATLSLDTAYLNQYNANNGTSYVLLPDSVYTTSGWNLTIPAGKRLDSMNVTFDFTKLDLSTAYILPITISQASLPIEQYNHLLLSVVLKNKYDGTYSLTEETVGWGAYNIADGLTFTWPSSVTFETSGGNSDLLNAGGYAQVGFDPSGNPLGFGAATPNYIFDPTTDLLSSIVNLTPDARNRAFTLNPAVTNSGWDAATGNIYMAYIMSQNGRPNQMIYDTLIYLGPR